MKSICIFLFCVTFVVFANPNPPTQFDSLLHIFTHWGKPEIFQGQMMWDVPNLKASLFLKQNGNYQLHIARWDQNKTYTIINNKCVVAGANKDQANPWRWLSTAIHRGSYSFGGQTCDLWISEDGSISGCFIQPKDIPLFLNLTRALDYVFDQFNIRPQNPSEFEPPSICSTNRVDTIETVHLLFLPLFVS